jgi:hypothetical protein
LAGLLFMPELFPNSRIFPKEWRAWMPALKRTALV